MILYGTNPIAWSNDDDPNLGGDISLEQCLSEASQIGFDGIEKGNKMPTNPDELKAVLKPHHLQFVSGWYCLNLLDRSVEEEKKSIQKHLDLLKAMGCKVCIACETSNSIQADENTALQDSPVLPMNQWQSFGANVEKISQYCQRQGITLVYHHHIGTVVENAEEIDLFMEHVGEETQLLLDTGHLLLAGADPTKVAKKYMNRTKHIHIKNVRGNVKDQALSQRWCFLDAVRQGVFTVPGDPDGIVDFEPVLKIAADHHYQGWLIVEAEQDPAVRNPYEYQSLGLKTLKQMTKLVDLE